MRPLVIFMIAAAVCFASHAQAQAEGTAPAHVQQDAKKYLQQGVVAYKEGRYKDAVDLFLTANRLVPSPALSFNAARAYSQLGDTTNALRWYRDYLRRAPEAPDRAEVQKKIDELEHKLAERGVQQVTVMSLPGGATVVIDGKPAGVTPWTGELTPGRHELTLQLRGYDDAHQAFDLDAARAMDVRVALNEEGGSPATEPEPVAAAPEPAPAPPPSAPPQQDQGSAGVGPAPFIAFGVGALALGGAVGFELARRSAESDAEAADTQIRAQEIFETAERRQTLARVFAGVGAAAVITGGVLLILDLSDDDAETAATRLDGGCTPGGCMLGARGRF